MLIIDGIIILIPKISSFQSTFPMNYIIQYQENSHLFLLLFSTEQMLRKAVLNHNNLVKYGILTSNVLVPSYIHQLDTRDGCQPALLPQPNNIIRPGSSFKHRACLCQNPKQ